MPMFTMILAAERTQTVQVWHSRSFEADSLEEAQSRADAFVTLVTPQDIANLSDWSEDG